MKIIEIKGLSDNETQNSMKKYNILKLRNQMQSTSRKS